MSFTAIFFIAFVILFILVPIILGLTVFSSKDNRPPTPSYLSRPATFNNYLAPTISKQQMCEQAVTHALRTLDMKSYVVFENLILPSRGNTSLTEIDQVVVSPYGIFCIETKSHRGSIYGFTTSNKWKQYLGGKDFDIMNPLRQNYKHTTAVEELLGSVLKAKVHSYVVFPNARSVKIDEKYADCSIDEVKNKISHHKTPVYNLQDCETILKTLAIASTKRDELKNIHIEEVRAYLNTEIKNVNFSHKSHAKSW